MFVLQVRAPVEADLQSAIAVGFESQIADGGKHMSGVDGHTCLASSVAASYLC